MATRRSIHRVLGGILSAATALPLAGLGLEGCSARVGPSDGDRADAASDATPRDARGDDVRDAGGDDVRDVIIPPEVSRTCNPPPPETRIIELPDPDADGGTDGGDASPPTNCYASCPPNLGEPPGPHLSMLETCSLATSDAGRPAVSCTYRFNCRPIGRRPAGLLADGAAPPGTGEAGATGAFFAELAELEHASIAAFEALARELALHGAPRALVRRARAAARDESRHTRMMGALARRFGARPARARVRPTAPRPLAEVARENAVEGCVRETYGALMAGWQARAAGDRVVRAAMERVARDETRHAQLAWDVAAWAEPRLGAAAREGVARARRAAVRGLLDSLRERPAEALVRTAGVPSADRAERLGRALVAALW